MWKIVGFDILLEISNFISQKIVAFINEVSAISLFSSIHLIYSGKNMQPLVIFIYLKIKFSSWNSFLLRLTSINSKIFDNFFYVTQSLPKNSFNSLKILMCPLVRYVSHPGTIQICFIHWNHVTCWALWGKMYLEILEALLLT